MPDAGHRQARAHGVARARVTGMRVAGDARGAHAVEPLQILDRAPNTASARGLPSVPMCGETTARRPQASATQFFRCAPTPSSGSRHVERQVDFERREPAAESQRRITPGDAPADRIVGGTRDRPIVVQEGIDHRRQPLLRHRFIGDHRLAAHVARGRDQRTAEAFEQQLVQRAVRQEHADFGQAGRDPGREPRAGIARHQHDRACGRVDQHRFRFGRRRFLAHGVEPIRAAPREHHGERLVRPPLAHAQRLNRALRSAHRTSGDSRRCP